MVESVTARAGKRKVKVMNTAFRDGFQSVFGGRVFAEDFLPAVEAAREAGITHFEAGGGARFQALYFFCNEDAFDMMDRFRAAAGPDANLQTLARGVNVVGLDSQSSDIIQLHPKLFRKHGITTIRNFDALNDVENLIYSGQCIAEAGLRHEVVVTMMELPPGATGSHTPDFYESVLRQILDADIPFDSVCFKDASGTSVPSKVYETIQRARKLVPEGVELRFHTHETAGISVVAYQAAIEAGADGIDLAMAPCSGGTSQPDIAVMWHALRGSDYELDLDIDKVMEAELVFKDCMSEYYIPPEALSVEPLIPWSPMPGGALTANTQLMRDHGILDRYAEVIQAMGEVVRRGGFGTSVTPVSQFYFQQAFNNVVFGPWKKIADGYGRMVLGYFGSTPVPPDPEVVRIASEQLGLEPNTRPILELNDEDPTKGIAPATSILQAEGLEVTDENIFIAATCKERGISFLKGEGKVAVRKKSGEKGEGSESSTVGRTTSAGSTGYSVRVDGRLHQVVVRGKEAIVDGRSYTVEVGAATEVAPQSGTGDAAQASARDSGSASNDGTPVQSKLPGSVIRIGVKAGDTVEEGDVIMVLEAMKMEIEVRAPRSGRVQSLGVIPGEEVPAGHELARIG
jgi:pyruvate carboxylase subunit B